MKTLNLLLATAILTLANLTNANAGNNETRIQAFTELDQQIQKALTTFPFEEIDRYDDFCLLTVTFDVNDNHEMKNIKVTGTDDRLAAYVAHTLEKKNIKVNDYFDGKRWRVPVRLVDGLNR